MLKPPIAPMEARSVDAIPEGSEWQYEPKWDGFRCIVFRDAGDVALQSKAGKPLTRYFPDIVAAVQAVEAEQFVLDGEIAVPQDGAFSFDALLQRIHPAKGRIEKLARETPALLIAFDLLGDPQGNALLAMPLHERRPKLEAFAEHFGDRPTAVARDDQAVGRNGLAEESRRDARWNHRQAARRALCGRQARRAW